MNATALSSSSPLPPPRTPYQYMNSFDKRSKLSKKMRSTYAGCIPVIIEPMTSVTPSFGSSGTCDGSAPVDFGNALPAVEPTVHQPESQNPAKGGNCDEASSGITGSHGNLPTSSSSVVTRREKSAGIQATSLRRPTGGLSSASSAPMPPLQSSSSLFGALKCVFPPSKSIAEVILTLRDRLVLDACQSVFLSVGEGDVLVPGNSLLGDLDERYHHADGFLYLGYMLENTFGGGGDSNSTLSPSPKYWGRCTTCI